MFVKIFDRALSEIIDKTRFRDCRIGSQDLYFNRVLYFLKEKVESCSFFTCVFFCFMFEKCFDKLLQVRGRPVSV
jgi:hypothetical protein